MTKAKTPRPPVRWVLQSSALAAVYNRNVQSEVIGVRERLGWGWVVVYNSVGSVIPSTSVTFLRGAVMPQEEIKLLPVTHIPAEITCVSTLKVPGMRKLPAVWSINPVYGAQN